MARLSLVQAETILEAALSKGRAMGLAPLAVAVLDPGGHLTAFGREDGAGILRPQIALGKAWGALGMGMGTRAFARRVAGQPPQQGWHVTSFRGWRRARCAHSRPRRRGPSAARSRACPAPASPPDACRRRRFS